MAYITNRQAYQRYEIIDTIKGGISLLGTEVKSIRSGKGSLIGSQILLNGTEIFLSGANIPPYQEANISTDFDPLRKRPILLTRKEIEKLYHTTEAKNLFIIPISLYASGAKIKLDIGIAQKKLAKNKREKIKRKDFENLDKSF